MVSSSSNRTFAIASQLIPSSSNTSAFARRAMKNGERFVRVFADDDARFDVMRPRGTFRQLQPLASIGNRVVAGNDALLLHAQHLPQLRYYCVDVFCRARFSAVAAPYQPWQSFCLQGHDFLSLHAANDFPQLRRIGRHKDALRHRRGLGKAGIVARQIDLADVAIGRFSPPTQRYRFQRRMGTKTNRAIGHA